MKWFAGLAVVGLIVAGAFAAPHLTGSSSEPIVTDPALDELAAAAIRTADGPAESFVVTLPAAKLAAAQILTEPVARQTLTHRHSVPGRVVYNDNLHIEVTAPTDGILTQVLVKPGDRVQTAQVLGWLNSPEIGTARADVMLRQHEAELTASLAARARSLAANVAALTKSLKGSPDFDGLKKQFADRQPGNYRNELFGALSSAVLAESLDRSSAGLAESGVLSGKTLQQRQAAAQAGRARLEAAVEQAEFDVWKTHDQAAATAADAQRRLEIARHHLASLLMSDDALHGESSMIAEEGTRMRVDLTHRDRQPELMDDPALDAERHRHALQGLGRINRFSRSTSMLWPVVRDVSRQLDGRRVRILDIASGGGDVALRLAAKAWASHVDVEITGCDISPFAIEHATQLAEPFPFDLHFVAEDAIHGTLDGPYDIVMCSLFLHHLPEDAAGILLRRMKELATCRVLVNDLRRTRFGYVLAWAGCRLLTRSSIVHTDGPLSVRAAFSIDEVRQLADDAGLNGATITTHWPQRFLLDWSPA
jgi:2-polyprenyl-3-methyl-5-hydroxy-6-metoxy-1,4-benzoquinol methylase